MKSEYITVRGFASMTQAEIVKRSVAHVLKNGEPSVSIDKNRKYNCRYDGIGCAAAPFIRPSERKAVSNFDWSDIAAPHHEYDLIKALQNCHDLPACKGLTGADFVEAFKDGVRDVCGRFGLPDSLVP